MPENKSFLCKFIVVSVTQQFLNLNNNYLRRYNKMSIIYISNSIFQKGEELCCMR